MKETHSSFSSLELLKIYFWLLNIDSLCQTLLNSFCLVYGGPIYTTSALLDVNELFNATEQNHFEKLVVSQLVKFPGLYGTQCSLLQSQESTICPYPEPVESSTCDPSQFLYDPF